MVSVLSDAAVHGWKCADGGRMPELASVDGLWAPELLFISNICGMYFFLYEGRDNS